jgi:hypothetical protein
MNEYIVMKQWIKISSTTLLIALPSCPDHSLFLHSPQFPYFPLHIQSHSEEEIRKIRAETSDGL